MNVPRRAVALVAVAGTVVMLWLPAKGTALAAPTRLSVTAPGHLGGSPYSPQQLSAQSGVASLSSGGVRYLYVDDGISPGHDGTTDAIEVFRLANGAATNVQTYPTTANQQADFYGANALAYVGPNRSHGSCLVLADGGGYVDSFTIDSSTHTISALVSSVHSVLYNSPSDVKIAFGGSLAIVTVAPTGTFTSGLESYQIGGGCALTAASSYSTTSRYFVSSALVGAGTVVTTDYDNSAIVTFSVTSEGIFTLLSTTPSALNYPDGVATAGRDVYTGNAYDHYSSALTQGGEAASGGRISYFRSSPARDGKGINGAAVWFNAQNRDLILGEQSSASLGFFSAGDSMKLTQHILLAYSGAQPTDFAQYGSTLLVDGNVSGDVEACALVPNGASGCATVAVLSNPTGYSDGIAVG